MRLRATRLTAIANAVRRLFGGVFAGAAAAYSVRVPAGSAYSGPLLRVRRSSDNTEQDIYSVATADANGNRWLDTTALLAFVGSGSGFVTTWYDQTGNARHATQTTASNQPRIVNAGVVDVVNGFPSLYSTSLPYLDIAAGFPGITAATGCAVYTQSGGTPTGASPWWIGDVTSGLADHWPWIAGEAYSSFFSASRQVFGPYDGGNNNLLIAGAVQDGSNLAIYRNGSLVNSVAVAAAVPNGARLFSGASPGPSYLSEAVIFPGSALTPRQTLEQSQGLAFDIASFDPLNLATWKLFDSNNTLSPLVTSTRASSGTYFDSAGVLQTAPANTPRVSYDPANLSAAPFLLAEELRTNSIRNNTMQGAVAGTPGTEPANWIVSGSGNGLTRNLAVGTENGIPYVDIGWSGTPTNSGTLQIFYEPNTQIVAANGQSWTNSVNMKIASGTLSGVGVIRQNIRGNTVGGSAVVGQTAVVDWQGFISSSASLSSQRRSVTFTFTDATVERVAANVSITYTINVPVNFTLRIGLPQLEQGATASSPILSNGTATTRAADNVRVNDLAATGFNASEGTVYVDGDFAEAAAKQSFMLQLTGSSSDYIGIYRDGTNQRLTGRVRAGGVDQAFLYGTATAALANTKYRQALRYGTNDFAFCVNGGNVFVDTSGTLPAGLTAIGLGNSTYVNVPQNGRIYQAAIIPTRLSDALLQRLTT